MIKYIRSGYNKADISLVLPSNLKTSVSYKDIANEELVWKVEGEEIDIEQFRLAINGIEVTKPIPLISPIQLMLLFPIAKRIAIRASTDLGVVDFLRILDDPRLVEVDRNKPFFPEAINYISSIIPLTPEEIQKILTGV